MPHMRMGRSPAKASSHLQWKMSPMGTKRWAKGTMVITKAGRQMGMIVGSARLGRERRLRVRMKSGKETLVHRDNLLKRSVKR